MQGKKKVQPFIFGDTADDLKYRYCKFGTFVMSEASDFRFNTQIDKKTQCTTAKPIVNSKNVCYCVHVTMSIYGRKS